MQTTKRNKYIGVFDSGFGGLHILKSIVKELPDYEYIYLGDTARTPYGTRSKETIYEFTKQAIDFLFSKNCKLVIIACNTASSDALHKLQQEYLPKFHPNKKILGVLIPSAEVAVEKTKNKKVGIMATKGTINSNAYIREITKIDKNIKTFQKACPMLVPLIESGEHNSKAAMLILENYLKSFKNTKIDTLILGCTHYGILKNKIKKIINPKIQIISSEQVVPKKLKLYLKRHKDIESNLKKSKKVSFYSTDLTDTFTKLGSKFFGKEIKTNRANLK
jgi:glutamate racemase